MVSGFFCFVDYLQVLFEVVCQYCEFDFVVDIEFCEYLFEMYFYCVYGYVQCGGDVVVGGIVYCVYCDFYFVCGEVQ